MGKLLRDAEEHEREDYMEHNLKIQEAEIRNLKTEREVLLARLEEARKPKEPERGENIAIGIFIAFLLFMGYSIGEIVRWIF